MHSNHPRLTSGAPGHGLLFSGSKDGSVKAWDTQGNMIQTLPHSSSVTKLADGKDGFMLSICVDGYLRMWSPQPGRDMLLHPFFECTHAISVLNPLDGWLASIAINNIGRWSCFLGGSDGSISVYRKPKQDLNLSVDEAWRTQMKVSRHARWEGVHTLSVTSMYVLVEQGFLVTMSANHACKILDHILGTTLYSVVNPHKCVFTGMALMSDTRYFLLVDQVGYIHKFDFTKEKLIGCLEVAKPSRTRRDKILNFNQDAMLGEMARFRDTDLFLVMMCPPPKRGFASQASDPGVLYKHDEFMEGGEVGLWCPLDVAGETVEFVAHTGPVVGIGIYTLNNSFAPTQKTASVEGDVTSALSRSQADANVIPGSKKGNEHVFQVSKEEEAFFSVASDKTVRCWDEFDASVAYTFKTASRADLTCMIMLWSMNSLVTGHENGLVTLWNSDAGTFVTSHALKSSVTCVVQARNSRSHILVGSL
jgi:WD40 repeat protein